MSTTPEQIATALRASVKEAERLRRHNHELVEAVKEPIAIVGMACRYPGADSPEQLWELIDGGGESISKFPSDRGWDLERLYDPDPDSVKTCYAREGGFLADVADFDPGFFGISPYEARVMDPQQRLILEASWEALEVAGLDPHSLRKTRSGVFAGVLSQDYGLTDLGITAGMTTSIVSGRVAYTLGLEGPAVTVDTACSSSLVTLHLAAQALRGRECDLALAGGVTVMATPSGLIYSSRQRGLAPDGRCKSFAEAADGAGLSEGVGMLVLERLSDAQANRHEVLAVVRGSAVNQDGASNGLTAPNGPSQERVIRQALANAGLAPADIDMVEAHGTGTTLGDPIEAGALLATYGQEREEPLKLGSIKSNIGHTQAAAGVAGVIKAVMAMREGVMPKTLHVDKPSSKVDWQAGKVELLTEAHEWQANGRPRRAAVSSFGVSGTNAHVILEEAPAAVPIDEEVKPGEGASPATEPPLPSGPFPLLLSAKSEAALSAQAERLTEHLRQNPELEPLDLACSLATTRSAFEHRAVALATDRQAALEGLGAIATGEDHPAVCRARAGGAAKAPVFLFPGQGSQWQGMAAELLGASTTFERSLRTCDEALSEYLDWSVCDVLTDADGAPLMESVEVIQPVIFAVAVALAELWRSCGVHPAAVAGHSQGEIPAAYVAGAISLSDAVRLSVLRSQIMGKLASEGVMISVALSVEQLAARIASLQGRIEVAAENGPSSTILSADRRAADELLAQCAAEGVRTGEIQASLPSHSTWVEPLREEVLEALAPISPRSSEVPFYSTVTGEVLDTAELDAEYWYRNLRQPVRFEAVTRRLLEQGHRVLIEISSHPVFALALGQTVEDALPDAERASVLATLRRDQGGPDRFALSLAEAHAAGAEVHWESFFAGSGASAVKLPTYPFQRKRYWQSANGRGDVRSTGQSPAEHPLLSAIVDDPKGEGVTLTGRLSLQSHPWLADHAVSGTVLLPGTAFVEMALRAAEEVGCRSVEELTLQAPLTFSGQGAVRLQVSVSGAGEDGRREVEIFSTPEDEEEPEWTCHAQGVIGSESPLAPEPLRAWPPEGAEPLEVDGVYERLADFGFEYGQAFQGARAAWRKGGELFVEVALQAEQLREAERFGVHPALLDSAGHVGIDVALAGAGNGTEDRPSLPFAWRGASRFSAGAGALRVCARAEGDGGGVHAFDESGNPVFSVESVVLRKLDPNLLQAATTRLLPLYRLEWVEAALPDADDPSPELVLERVPEKEGSLPSTAHATALWALQRAQEWIAAPPSNDARLALLTKAAIAAAPDDDPDMNAASVWGLLRTAQSEHPDRFCLIDSDESEASRENLPAALALLADEPQIALRQGKALVPRLARADIEDDSSAAPADPERTILITGGTSGLGALIARHLAERHGARHLLLASRSGEGAEGAMELKEELERLGAEATIAACDVADRSQLEALLASIPAEHPLGTVIHSAAQLDDGVLDLLDGERLRAVMRPKVDASWHLHELTAELDLARFVLFSSAIGTFGGAGQANYAAANAFLDALAAHRRARGLPAVSLAWGGWNLRTEMVSSLSEADLTRMQRFGISALDLEVGLTLFDIASGSTEPLLVPVQLDNGALRRRASLGTLPAIFRGLVRFQGGVERRQESLAKRLAGVPESEREDLVLNLVRTHAAAVLGHATAESIEAKSAFSELGFDSLAAVEMRNRLNAATGLRLPPTLVFDHPTAASVAAHLLTEVEPQREPAAGEAIGREAEEAISRLAAAIPSIREDERARVAVGSRLRELLVELAGAARDENGGADLTAMSNEEMFELIDHELGTS
jgi:acyl transferase domain-containing protein/NAD(P)-dependent dehydrogenase (short-subunit alcohol dehydrogenase family)/acyl carrier protein